MNEMLEQLKNLVDNGYINAIKNGDLTLYNYTNKTVFEKNWNECTLSARGLVLNKDVVVARPWKKFFNLGERPEDKLPVEIPELSKKYDGSLVIVFWCGTWMCCTRGCWDNQQTKYVNEWLITNGIKLNKNNTYMFELIAPWNRIVVPYKTVDLILIGIVETNTCRDFSYKETRDVAIQHGLTPIEFDIRPINSINLDEKTINEGFVARFSNGYRVKIKYKQYLRLHKILTGLSITGIWEMLRDNQNIEMVDIPDEFIDWYTTHKTNILKQYTDLEAKAISTFEIIKLKQYQNRKEWALEISKYKDIATILFRMLDNRSYNDIIWKHIRPTTTETFNIMQV
jgi:RNA ligase